jgi:hypothetical protein
VNRSVGPYTRAACRPTSLRPLAWFRPSSDEVLLRCREDCPRCPDRACKETRAERQVDLRRSHPLGIRGPLSSNHAERMCAATRLAMRAGVTTSAPTTAAEHPTLPLDPRPQVPRGAATPPSARRPFSSRLGCVRRWAPPVACRKISCYGARAAQRECSADELSGNRDFGRARIRLVYANLCAKFGRAKNQTLVSKPVTSTFSALGGIRTPNLLIRSWLPSVLRCLTGSGPVPLCRSQHRPMVPDLDDLGQAGTLRDPIVGSDVGFRQGYDL